MTDATDCPSCSTLRAENTKLKNDEFWLQTALFVARTEAAQNDTRAQSAEALLREWVELKELLGADSYDGIEPTYVERLDDLASRSRLQQAANTLVEEHASSSSSSERAARLASQVCDQEHRVFLEGDTAEAFTCWLAAERLRHIRIAEYNARLKVVNEARRGGDWSDRLDIEYHRMTAATSTANVALNRLSKLALSPPLDPSADDRPSEGEEG